MRAIRDKHAKYLRRWLAADEEPDLTAEPHGEDEELQVVATTVTDLDAFHASILTGEGLLPPAIYVLDSGEVVAGD